MTHLRIRLIPALDILRHPYKSKRTSDSVAPIFEMLLIEQMRFVASLILRIDTSYTRIGRAKKVDTEGRVDNIQVPRVDITSKGGES